MPRALSMLRPRLISTFTFFNRFLRSKPLTGKPSIGYPAAGTRLISIRPFAPTNKMSASGKRLFNALAMLMAGKICPPVPPPLMMNLCGIP